ncbi:MAG: hypothetical protein PHG18_05050 [Bacilli bacterium]|nr:hypothetical protein [Bacilli bacterium]
MVIKADIKDVNVRVDFNNINLEELGKEIAHLCSFQQRQIIDGFTKELNTWDLDKADIKLIDISEDINKDSKKMLTRLAGFIEVAE